MINEQRKDNRFRLTEKEAQEILARREKNKLKETIKKQIFQPINYLMLRVQRAENELIFMLIQIFKILQWKLKNHHIILNTLEMFIVMLIILECIFYEKSM